MAINTDAYEEMINTFNTFLSSSEEQCAVMDGAASDLSDNMEGDVHAAQLSGTLLSCVSGIRSALEGVTGIVQGLQSELEKAQSAGLSIAR